MNKKILADQKWTKILTEVNKLKPDFGSLSINLYFHQKNLVKVEISNKVNILLFKKEENNEENCEK
jgi:hypothetical protein